MIATHPVLRIGFFRNKADRSPCFLQRELMETKQCAHWHVHGCRTLKPSAIPVLNSTIEDPVLKSFAAHSPSANPTLGMGASAQSEAIFRSSLIFF